MENESLGIIAGQSYMKMTANPAVAPLVPKRMSLVVERKQEISDTDENASPHMLIGPKDSSCCVDERYDFPRSYNVQAFSGSTTNIGTMGSASTIHHGHLMTSTPNLIHSGVPTLDRSQLNFYSNAPPRENNIFRFDFTSSAPPPDVNRTLKPRKELSGYGVIKNIQPAPTVDRKLKPGSSKVLNIAETLKKSLTKFSFQLQLAFGTNSLKRRGPETLSLSEVSDSAFLDDSLVSI